MLERLLPAPLLAPEWLGSGDDLPHLLLDAWQVLVAQSDRRIDVVVEAVFDDRSDTQLAAGVQLLDGFGEHVRRRMAHHVQLLVRRTVMTHGGTTTLSRKYNAPSVLGRGG